MFSKNTKEKLCFRRGVRAKEIKINEKDNKIKRF